MSKFSVVKDGTHISPRPQMVFLAGLAGTGKSTFAPHLATALDAHVFDTDILFAALRASYSEAVGVNAISDPGWVTHVHPMLIHTMVALAAGTVSSGRSAIVVSPLGRFLGRPGGMESLISDFEWARPIVLLAECAETIRLSRVASRSREIDVAVHNVPLNPIVPAYPYIRIDLSCDVDAYPILARSVASSISEATEALLAPSPSQL